MTDSTDEEIIDILLPVEELRRENNDLRAELALELATVMALRAENDRLRAQVAKHHSPGFVCQS